jgi:hypothetical protein
VAKTKFTYSGAPTRLALREKDPKGKDARNEVSLQTGKAVELDADNPYVKSLVARGLLKEVCASAQPGRQRAGRGNGGQTPTGPVAPATNPSKGDE